jgi:hypothetical protein
VGSLLFRSLALFIGVIALGSVLPDVFRFIQDKEWMGHSFIIPVIILFGMGFTYCLRLFAGFLLRRFKWLG